MVFQVILGIKHQSLFILALIRRFFPIDPFQTAMLGPLQTEIDTPTRMQGREQALQGTTMENGLYQAYLPMTVGIVQPVTMGKIEDFTSQFKSLRLTMQNHATLFLQVIATPHIVVSHKIVHLHTHIGQF